MSDGLVTEHRKVSCVCGKLEFVVAEGLVSTNIRCPWCPPEQASPTLRLVK